jgi:alginate O-acetyltransferase complex protein AlgI
MIFSSSLFLLYFLPFTLLLYYLADQKFKNWILLLSSIFFYAWGAPKFIFYMGAAVVADFYLIALMNRREGFVRHLLFWLSVALNLGMLIYFKYMNFFVDQFNHILGTIGSKPLTWTAVLLPIGISFITFQKLAYTLDVYKRKHEVMARLQDYALYIFMFPQLLSGPIVRPGQIYSQILNRGDQETTDYRLSGFYRFMIGMAKKVLIADTLGVQVNQIFALSSHELSSSLAWIGAIAYTFQIYFDFSGYSDMAIGLARMFGFRLPENFNFPYISQSVTEFWRRWHITLSFWFRDYIFLPLAYKTSRWLPEERYLDIRADKVIYIIAAMVTFLLCGLWHGAAWNFILWGGYMGLFLILDRLFLLRFMKKTGRIPRVIITFFILMFGWIIFRAENLDYINFFVRRMFSFESAENTVWLNPKFWTMLILAALFSFAGLIKKAEAWVDQLYLAPRNSTIVLFTLIAIVLLILNEATISSSGFSPFIYFRF